MTSIVNPINSAEFTLPTKFQANRRGAARWILSHAARHFYLVVLMLAGAVSNAVLATLVPVFVGQAFNAMLASPPDLSVLPGIAVWIGLTQVLRGALQFVRNFSAELIGQKLDRDVREDLYVSLLGKSMTFHSLQPVGDTMARATNDVREINLMFNPGLNLVIGSAIFMFTPIIVSYSYHPSLVLIPLLFVIGYFLLCGEVRVEAGSALRLAAPRGVRPGGLGMAYQMAYIVGLNYTTAGNSSVLMATAPVWTILLSTRLHGERVQGQAWAGMAMSFAGILMIIFGSGKELTLGAGGVLGDRLSLGAAMLWALNARMQKFLLARYSAMQLSLVSTPVGALGLGLAGVPAAMTLSWQEVPPGWYVAAILSGGLSIAAANVPSSALAPELTSDYHERTSIQSFRSLFGWLGGMGMLFLTFGVLLAPTAEYPVGQLNPEGYRTYALFASGFMVLSILASALGTHREIARLPRIASTPATLGETFKGVGEALGNRGFIVLMIAGVFAYTNQGLNFALSTYFNTYLWEFPASVLAIFTLCVLAGVVIALILATQVSKVWGKRNAAVVFSLVYIVVATTPYFLRARSRRS